MTEPATTQKPTVQQASGEDGIRIRAYELYEKRKGGPGDAESDWYRAEAELKGDAAEPAK